MATDKILLLTTMMAKGAKTKLEARFYSECCNAKAPYCPPCFGDEGFHACESCNTHCDVYWKETLLVTHIKVSQGIYRPVENCT